MISFSCPRCHELYWYESSSAGQKITCVKCGQRLQVPSTSAAPSNKTVLGIPEKPLHQIPEVLEVRPPKRKANGFFPFHYILTVACGCASFLIICLGAYIALYFWAVYDTSVPVYEYVPEGPRVHNVGLMQNRTIGVIIGLACSGIGSLLLIGSMITLVMLLTRERK